MEDAKLYEIDTLTWIKKPQIIEIGINVTSIGSYTFYECSKLTDVKITNSVTNIKDWAFF